MIAYKLTDALDRTHGDCQWGEGVEHSAPGGEPCTDGVIHWYADPLLAVFHDPIHGKHGPDANLWECEVEQTGTDGLKCWGTRCRTLRRVPLPRVATVHRVRYAILVVLAVLPEDEAWVVRWTAWAEEWLSGRRRSPEAARTVAEASETVIESARMAARAAAAAARAAQVGYTDPPAWAAQPVPIAYTEAVRWAARAVHCAVEEAAEVHGKVLDLLTIAKQAVAAEKKDDANS